ncbi:hypothetical protein Dimus_007809 [Dionaea muscipula]
MPDEEEERSGTSCGRNLAPNHIELQRLSGIVNFAGLHNVYDLSFFNEIRSIEYVSLPLCFLFKYFFRKHILCSGEPVTSLSTSLSP